MHTTWLFFCFHVTLFFRLRIIYWNIKTLPIVLIPINGSNWQTFHCCFIKIWEKNKNKLHESDLWDCRAVWLLLCSLSMDFYNMTTIHCISICSLKKISWLPECVLYCGSPAGSQRESKYIFNEVICNNNCVHGPDLLMLSTTAKPSFGMKKLLLEWNDDVQHHLRLKGMNTAGILLTGNVIRKLCRCDGWLKAQSTVVKLWLSPITHSVLIITESPFLCFINMTSVLLKASISVFSHISAQRTVHNLNVSVRLFSAVHTQRFSCSFFFLTSLYQLYWNVHQNAAVNVTVLVCHTLY